jgi:RimJ/RimL family protein N-acetyltransferase
MTSERLHYEPLTAGCLDDLHRLVQDEHVRRYLMDGAIHPREWSEERIRQSAMLFERRGVGLWLARERHTGDVVGFCGFLEVPSLHPEPQLVYALFERYAGEGLATAMARTVIAAARERGFTTIVAGVDAANLASVRVLEKLGFKPVSVHQGAFGDALLLTLEESQVSGFRGQVSGMSDVDMS